jgi:hypothetical protein
MSFPQSKPGLNSEILVDGEYYAFSQQQGDKICLGYIYTTWCGNPCGRYIQFSSVKLGEQLSLVSIGNSQDDKGQLKTFSFDSRNLHLIDDVYNRAMSWLNKMQCELRYPQLDESAGCIPAVIVVNQGALCAFSGKEDFLKAFTRSRYSYET